MKTVAVIGLGKMGSAIAARLLEAGKSLIVYNRTQNKLRTLIKKGAIGAESIKDAVFDADVIISCLFDDNAVLEVTLGPSGILQYAKKSAVHIGTATILPDTAEKIFKAHQKQGSQYISAAVLGNPKTASLGKLTLFCSGNEEVIQSCESILKKFSEKIINLGEQPRASAVMKIGLNYCLATMLEIISELYVFFEKNGLDLEIMQEWLHKIYAHPGYKWYIDKIKDRDFDHVNSSMQCGFKDISNFQKAFADVGVVPRLGDLLKGRYISAIANGMGEKDWSAIYEVVRKESGLESC